MVFGIDKARLSLNGGAFVCISSVISAACIGPTANEESDGGGAMLILFDIDGTLLDHKTAERRAATILYESVDARIPLEEFLVEWETALERHFARYLSGEVSHQGQRRDRVREVIEASLSDEAADRVFAEYLAHYEASWSLFSDVRPCLDCLSGHRLGVISNGDGRQQRRKLAQTGVLDRFDCVVISGECGCAKPDAAIFVRACARAGESPADSVYVGDHYDHDAHAARAAGLMGIWLDRGRQAAARHAPPVIDSLDRLPAVLVGAATPPHRTLESKPARRRG